MPKCPICQKEFKTQYSTLQKTCNTKCALDYARHKTRQKKSKAITKAAKDYRKSKLSYQHKLTQPVFNRLRVLQEFKWFRDHDQEPTCISCGKPNKDWCCGHYKTVGSRSDLRYDPKNTYLQCNFYCNCSLSGNLVKYREGLLNRFGPHKFKVLMTYLERRQTTDWTAETLEAFRLKCRKEIRELEEEMNE